MHIRDVLISYNVVMIIYLAIMSELACLGNGSGAVASVEYVPEAVSTLRALAGVGL